MAKVKINPMFDGISGKVGDVIFRRLANGEMSVSRVLARSNAAPSAAQYAHRQRFKQAVALAKAALADPETRSRYEAAAARSNKTAYNLALADFMKKADRSVG